MRFNVGGATYSLNDIFLVFASTANVLLLVQHQIAEQVLWLRGLLKDRRRS
jgi:hypothetical protein